MSGTLRWHLPRTHFARVLSDGRYSLRIGHIPYWADRHYPTDVASLEERGVGKPDFTCMCGGNLTRAASLHVNDLCELL